MLAAFSTSTLAASTRSSSHARGVLPCESWMLVEALCLRSSWMRRTLPMVDALWRGVDWYLSIHIDCQVEQKLHDVGVSGGTSPVQRGPSVLRSHNDRRLETCNASLSICAYVTQNLTRLYLDKATLVWNGNAVSGQDALNEFFESLPSSEFQVQTLDCQPVHEQATQGQTTLLVVTGGTVKFEGNKQRFFNQNFLLTAQATANNDLPVWKIASDCFRFQDWNN
ncbi:NTF2-related export protein 2 [Liparis tanakae]|uniref:NTF2-related export protein 2 n=1 Tax=Liparis tanakae TaxID=230148 RepID=A0A4Z2FAZ5_9TELE|nr:NTF2-related export protein 2 [Liparis tanakae]